MDDANTMRFATELSVKRNTTVGLPNSHILCRFPEASTRVTVPNRKNRRIAGTSNNLSSFIINYYETTTSYITIFSIFTIEPPVNSDLQLINGEQGLYYDLINYGLILTSMTKQY
jgi:hypothetical protein